MKSRLLNLIAAVLLTSTLMFVPATIMAEDSTTSGSGTTTTKTEADEAKETETENEIESHKTLAERIAEHKDMLKTKLTALEENRLKLRCKAGQGLVSQLNEKVGTNAAERVKHYEELHHHLDALVPKLKAAGIDTTTLEQEMTTLDGKAAKIKADFTAYKQQLADLKDVDCVSDPTGFKAALEAARTSRDNIVKEIADIKAYVKDTIKPTLADLRKQLEQKESAGQGQ